MNVGEQVAAKLEGAASAAKQVAHEVGAAVGLGADASVPSAAQANKTDADNTRVNKRDANGETLTPTDQGNNDLDLGITQEVRKAVMANDSLSFNAKNVKIVTLRRKVTLRGPVASASERQTILAAAKRAKGVVSVDDQLEVKP
jgi:osmotically-inducible protein OsmY